MALNVLGFTLGSFTYGFQNDDDDDDGGGAFRLWIIPLKDAARCCPDLIDPILIGLLTVPRSLRSFIGFGAANLATADWAARGTMQPAGRTPLMTVVVVTLTVRGAQGLQFEHGVGGDGGIVGVGVHGRRLHFSC